jgi:hypothetical protein
MELLITKYPKEPLLGGTKYMFTYTVKLVYKGNMKNVSFISSCSLYTG